MLNHLRGEPQRDPCLARLRLLRSALAAPTTEYQALGRGLSGSAGAAARSAASSSSVMASALARARRRASFQLRGPRSVLGFALIVSSFLPGRLPQADDPDQLAVVIFADGEDQHVQFGAN
jgi:hypothetical protein